MAFFALGFVTILAQVALALPSGDDAPFLEVVDSSKAIVGNSVWNATVGPNYAKPIYYNGKEIVGSAKGQYYSYAQQSRSFQFADPTIVESGDDFIDIKFTASEGEAHWVIYRNQHGAYQYFINKDLPSTLGEWRSLSRLDNETFPNGYNSLKQGALPTLSEIESGEKVQDETYKLDDGSYITKYDWSDFINSATFWGVYGDEVGCWYIHPSKEYINGDHMKQELMVHRESNTGDTVLLNMIHGLHFQTIAGHEFAEGRIWGPWLWYLNDGSIDDASAKYDEEVGSWPYSFPSADIESGHHQRAVSIEGVITLSDGRPASGANVMLGDNNNGEIPYEQGSNYYYRTTADSKGSFAFENVRAATYALYAWAGNNSDVSDVSTNLTVNDIEVSKTTEAQDIGDFTWGTQKRTKIWQIGDLDRLPRGFKNGCTGYHHGLSDDSPANLNFTVNSTEESEWAYAQSAEGTWQVSFELPSAPDSDAIAVLSTSFAGYSSGVNMEITAQSGGVDVGEINDLANDPSVYRSSTFGGLHRYEEIEVPAGTFKEGTNTIEFTVTKGSEWHGFMWDSVLLEWS
ncbi:polysaccharide lyase family 4, domain III-domain-containing protein [Aspergillus avenaceus]|uniref:rhamnogalacturonan endolyase n=1 Tax=Aspergillus avenaceus TaxID=36643 RepID=A0A5N6TYP9_ASPAV|nr:polysaccharide lyase family 4, domain III-domain-containing protein [Aspergillus avenaceus]